MTPTPTSVPSLKPAERSLARCRVCLRRVLLWLFTLMDPGDRDTRGTQTLPSTCTRTDSVQRPESVIIHAGTHGGEDPWGHTTAGRRWPHRVGAPRGHRDAHRRRAWGAGARHREQQQHREKTCRNSAYPGTRVGSGVFGIQGAGNVPVDLYRPAPQFFHHVFPVKFVPSPAQRSIHDPGKTEARIPFFGHRATGSRTDTRPSSTQAWDSC